VAQNINFQAIYHQGIYHHRCKTPGRIFFRLGCIREISRLSSFSTVVPNLGLARFCVCPNRTPSFGQHVKTLFLLTVLRVSNPEPNPEPILSRGKQRQAGGRYEEGNFVCPDSSHTTLKLKAKSRISTGNRTKGARGYGISRSAAIPSSPLARVWYWYIPRHPIMYCYTV